MQSIFQVDAGGYSGTWFTPVGWGMIGIGLIAVLYGLFASGAPEFSETLNIGLLNDKTNLVIAGGLAFTSGFVLVAAEAIIEQLSLLNAAVKAGAESAAREEIEKAL
jgi:hypothetical protein